MNRSHLLKWLAVMALLVYWSCGDLQVAGGTSETTNGFMAAIRDQNGNPVAYAHILVRPQSYLSDTSNSGVRYDRSSVMDTVADSLGRVTVKNLTVGGYTVEIRNGTTDGAILRTEVVKDRIVDCGIAETGPLGTISGIVDSASMSVSAMVYALIRGIERTARTDSVTGLFSINDLPQGSYTVRLIGSQPYYAPRDLDNVTVISGSTNDIGTVALNRFNAWNYSMRLTLNTTLSGADVSTNIRHFPVLVRLTGMNFNFNEANITGNDIRFAKTGDIPLPYEIERWDASAQQAEVWVKVDTVFGNDSTQFITMYWGNPDASNSSNGATVFDTGSGFQGVWHLAEPTGTLSHDATANHFDGTPSDSAPGAVSGAIGMAKEFDGVSKIIKMNGTATGKLDFPERGVYSISAWVNVDSVFNNDGYIAGKSASQYVLKSKGLTSDQPLNFSFEELDETPTVGWERRLSPSTINTWKYLVGVRNGNKAYLYVDGVCTDSIGSFYEDTCQSRTPSTDFVIGKEAKPYYLKGRIDEVSVFNVTQDADWIKLCYMNQRMDDKLVVFK